MRKSFIDVITNNLPYKLAALVLAFLAWYIVQGEEILEVNRHLIVHVDPADGYMIRPEEATQVKDITLRGPRVLLGDFSTRPLEAHIKIPDGKLGKFRFLIDKEYIENWDSRIALTVHDPYVNVFVDERVERRVPVKEVLQGTPGEGSIIEKVTIKPSMVTITGLKSEISKIREVATEPIDISGLQQSKTFDADLVANGFDKSGLSTTRVNVSLQVGEKKINTRFTNIPVEVVGSNYLTDTRPDHVSIVIQGTPGVLHFVRRADLRAFVEVHEISPGRYDKSIQVKIPPDTVLIETVPDKATVEVYNQKRID